MGDLWSERPRRHSVQNFDRPGTWISGVRIGLDHPFTGLGEEEIVRALGDVREYRQTPLGDTSVLPHNSWILPLAEGGFIALFVVLCAHRPGRLRGASAAVVAAPRSASTWPP